MNYIDLHVHSNVSDGTLSPREVVFRAAEKGLKAIALTDHDTVGGIEEAVAAAEELKEQGIEIEIIAGTELSACYQGHDIHILGLFLDYKDETLRSAMDAVVAEREQRNVKMCKNLQDAGIPITIAELRKDNADTVITRAHFAKFLVEHHFAKSNKDAFERYLDHNGPYYVPRQYLTPKTAIELILAAGGIPVLAHPLLYGLSKEELDTLLVLLKKYGLVGIETIYSNNMGWDESDVRRMARIHNLLMTGGSDYHGSNKPHIELGVGRGNLKIPESFLVALKEVLVKQNN